MPVSESIQLTTLSVMFMLMMRIRKVRMRVRYRFVPMRMTMPRIGGNRIVVCVLVVLIMNMLVMVFNHFVRVYVLMTFGEMIQQRRMTLRYNIAARLRIRCFCPCFVSPFQPEKIRLF